MEPQATDAASSVLERAFSVLRAFNGQRSELTLTELTRATGLPKATTHRLCTQLVELQALERVEHAYRIGIGVYELGMMAPRRSRLRDAAYPFMEDLLEVGKEMVHLAVLDGTDVVYIERISGHRGKFVNARSGYRRPAYCTGLGKAMLAFSDDELLRRVLDGGLQQFTKNTLSSPLRLRSELHQVRTHGVAYDREEYSPGVSCVAAPVLSRTSKPIAALSLVTSTPGRPPVQIANAVKTVAEALSRRLQARPDLYWGADAY